MDTSEAKNVEGTRIIQEDDLIAVLHEDPEQADKALRMVKARWDKPEAKVDENSIFDHLLQVAPEGEVLSEKGVLAEGEKFPRL